MRSLILLLAITIVACGGNHATSGADAQPGGPGGPGDDDASMPCGNGAIESGEQCDDGNTASGDGCTASCQVELGWICIAAGSPCLREVYCGDGVVDAPETC